MRIAIVLRTLNPHATVVSAVISTKNCPTDVDNVDGWLASEAEDHIKEFKETFVEFRSATFTVTYHDID